MPPLPTASFSHWPPGCIAGAHATAVRGCIALIRKGASPCIRSAAVVAAARCCFLSTRDRLRSRNVARNCRLWTRRRVALGRRLWARCVARVCYGPSHSRPLRTTLRLPTLLVREVAIVRRSMDLLPVLFLLLHNQLRLLLCRRLAHDRLAVGPPASRRTKWCGDGREQCGAQGRRLALHLPVALLPSGLNPRELRLEMVRPTVGHVDTGARARPGLGAACGIAAPRRSRRSPWPTAA